MYIAELLARARELRVDRLDAELLLAHELKRPRSWLLAHDDDPIDASAAATLSQLLERRAGGTPLAYLIGEKEFFGLPLTVSPAVLVPRPETELLVEWALEVLPLSARSPRVVDLGTGSGAIAIAIAVHRPSARVSASDASAGALEVAAANAARHSAQIALCRGAWWEPFAGRHFELAASNPPYVAAGDVHLNELRFEPQAALVSGGDGLDALRAIVADAPAHLLAGAWLLLEHGFEQGGSVRRLFRESGFSDIETRRDLAGNERCTGGRWLGA